MFPDDILAISLAVSPAAASDKFKSVVTPPPSYNCCNKVDGKPNLSNLLGSNNLPRFSRSVPNDCNDRFTPATSAVIRSFMLLKDPSPNVCASSDAYTGGFIPFI